MTTMISRRLPVVHGSCLAALALAMSLSVPAYAQDSTTEAAPDAGLQDIVVTAQRRSERLSQVPISVQAVSGDTLSRSAVLDTRMLESISPSVSFSSGFNSAASSVSIRGVSSASYEGGIQPSVALVVDGVPVARQNEFIFDFADIERIEVLSGPQGTLFGKNSTGGVVSVVTKRPTDRFEGYVEGLATTDDEYSLRGVVNAPLGIGISARLNGFFRDQAPNVKNIGGPDVNGTKTYGVSGSLQMELSPEAKFLLSGGYSRLKSTYAGNVIITPITGPLGVLQTQVIGLPFGRGAHVINQDGDNHDFAKSWNVTGELNWDISDTVSLDSVTGYRTNIDENDIDADATPVGVSRGTGFTPNPLNYPLMWVNYGKDRIYNKLRYGSQEFRLNLTSDRFTVVGGVFLQTYRETRDARQGLILAASYAGITGVPPTTQFFNDGVIRARIKDDTAAVFGDVTFKVTPTLNLFGGLRFTIESLNADYRRDTYFNPVAGFFNPVTLVNTAPPTATVTYNAGRTDRNLSGRAGIQWRPSSSQNYYFSYNRGYKGAAANISQAATGINPLLDPEIGSAFELGMKQRFWDGRLSVDLALYHQVIDNIQQTSVLPNSILTDLINAGKLRSDGIELNLAASPVSGLKLTLGGAYTDARYKGGRFACNGFEAAGKCDANGIKSLTGEQAYGAPKYKITSAVDYDYDMAGPLTITSHAAYGWQSSVQYQLGDDPLTREPKRGILNVSLGLRSDEDRFDISLFVNNVTNKYYFNFLNHADFFIARSYGQLPRDYKRYAGVRAKYSFGG